MNGYMVSSKRLLPEDVEIGVIEREGIRKNKTAQGRMNMITP